jgi:hypothetical protein
MVYKQSSKWCHLNDVIAIIRVSFMVFNTTFNNSSVISRQSVLLVEESGENNLSEFTDKPFVFNLNSICKTIVTKFKNYWLLLETPLNFHLFGKIC